MPPKELLDDAALVHCFIEHNKSIERMQWKNNDAQEFCQGCLPLLKGLSKTSPNPPKSQLRKALQAAKLSISSSEAELLIEKIRSSMKWARAKLRNSGSGAFLPAEVKTLGKLWARVKVPSKKKNLR